MVGAVALGVACDTLAGGRHGGRRGGGGELCWPTRAGACPTVPGLHALPRLARRSPAGRAFSPSTSETCPYDLLAAVLSAEYGIGIRHGCFCAHPLMMRLLKRRRRRGESADRRDARRPSRAPARRGPPEPRPGLHPRRCRHRRRRASRHRHRRATLDVQRKPGTDEYEPDPDPRPLPPLSMRLVEHPHGHGESA